MASDPVSNTTPKAGEVWRNKAGAVRHVRDVDADEYSVVYSRQADGHAEWRTVLMRDWHIWAEDATRTRKAATVIDRDWGYAEATR